MVKVQARGIRLDADGLGITLRVNGYITSPVPVVILDVNDGFKQVTTAADWENHHPSGGYTDLHYVLGEEVMGIDVAYATGITNAPTFEDTLVANGRNGGNKGTAYDYVIQSGTVGDEYGYKSSDFGHIFKNKTGVKLATVAINGLDGSIAVVFADNDKPSKAITVVFEGLVVPDLDQTDGEALTIRLDWSDANDRYEVGTSASMVAVGEYMAKTEGATLGLSIALIQ